MRMQNESRPNSTDITLTGVVALATRAAACWAPYFYIGALGLFIGLFRLHPYATGDGALIVPWLSLPLSASASIAGAYAVWGGVRPDQIGAYGQLAIALWAVISALSIGVDALTNRHPSDHPLVGAVFSVPLLLLVANSAAANALARPQRPWGGIPKTMLGLLPSLASVLAARGAVSGCMKAFRDGFDGWAVFTTPVVGALSALAAILALALVRLAWRILSVPLPQQAISQQNE